jgi:hypothetical protein
LGAVWVQVGGGMGIATATATFFFFFFFWGIRGFCVIEKGLFCVEFCGFCVYIFKSVAVAVGGSGNGDFFIYKIEIFIMKLTIKIK